MAQKQVSLKITVDGKELDLAKTSVEQFDAAYSAAAQKLSTLKVDSDEWKKLNSELQHSKKAFEDTKNAANNTDGKFKSLRSQIRETTVSLQALADKGQTGTAEFEKMRKKLDELNDAQEKVSFQAGQFDDKLAALPGPIGNIGKGIQGLNQSFNTFGKTLTISLGIVGLLVTAFFAIKDALGKTKEGTQLLAQATTAFNKVLAPLFAILEKIGTIVLPIVIKGFEMLGSVMSAVGEFFGVKAEKVDEVTASLEKNNEAANKLAEEEKARAEKEKQLQEQRTQKLKEESERRKQINEAAEKVMNDARLALMNEKDREIEVATQKHKENVKALRAAGNRNITLEEERYSKELLLINEKYKKLILEQDRAFASRLVSLQNEQYDLNIQRNQQALENTKNNNLATLTNELSFAQQIKDVQREKLDFTQEIQKEDLKNTQAAQMEALVNAKASADKIKRTELQFAAERLAQQMNFDEQIILLTKETEMEKAAIIKKYADEGKKVEFDIIQSRINDLDKLSAKLNFDFNEDVERNKLKIEDVKKQQAIEEEMARGQADVLFRIKREYGDKINAIEVENTRIKFAEEQQRYQIAIIYANAAAQVGQILQQLAGERRELALIGLAIEKAAALTSIAINAKKNFIADGGIKSPLAWANLAAAGVQAAAVVASYVLGVASIKKAGSTSSSSAGTASGGTTAGGGEAYNGLGRNYEDGGLINGPRHAQGGVMIEAEGGEAVMTRGAVTMFAPLLSQLNQMGGGTSFNSAITSGGPSFDNPKIANTNTEQNPMVIKTYVVSNDMTSEQQKQARLKDLSTL
jgi:hypothetical protein